METIERFKHIALAILLAIAGISFAACSSDNEEGNNGDDNGTKNFDIVGTWETSWGDSDSKCNLIAEFKADKTGRFLLKFDGNKNSAFEHDYVYSKFHYYIDKDGTVRPEQREVWRNTNNNGYKKFEDAGLFNYSFNIIDNKLDFNGHKFGKTDKKLVNPLENEDKGSEEDKGNNEDNNSDNKLVGNWYKTFYYSVDKCFSHELYSFCKDMKYKYSSVDTNMTIEEGTYRYTADSLFLTPNNGKQRKYKISNLTDKTIWINSSAYNKSTLTGLDDGDVPDKSDPGINLLIYNSETGDVIIEIIPHWGMKKIYYSLSENENDKKSMCTSAIKKTYKNLKSGTKYYLTAYGIDSKGIEHVSAQNYITTLGYAGTKNYFSFNYKSYQINMAEMSAHHGYSGTGTGSNEKKLRFYCDDDTFIEFNYNVAEWEGISKEWAEGTYNISRQSGYYKYGCFLKIDGNTKSQSIYDFAGTLKIKKTSNSYYTFDFNLNDVKGHFEGSVK